MATREYQFIVGPETSTLPAIGTPSTSTDLITLGYADAHYTQGKASVASVAALKAVGSSDRADGMLVVVQATNTAYIFDAGSSDSGDDNNVLTPGAGTGRWIKVRENQLTASKALASDANGYVSATSVTSTELGYLSGVTSAIQTQLGGKATLASANTFTDTTQSTSKDTGSMILEGGLGVEKNVYVGGNLVVTGGLQVDGTTTTVNSTTLEVTDANIVVNNGGNDASSEDAGITVERTTTDAAIKFANALTSKFKAGLVGSESEIMTVGTAQTVTGIKTFDEEIIMKEQSTPAAAASTYRKLYPKSDGSWYHIGSDGIETALGSGGTGKNYFAGAVSSGASTTGFSGFVDAAATSPVDGTGGSPSANLAMTTSTSSPLSGSSSILISKINSVNLQGQGFAYDFTIDPSDKGKVCSFTMNYGISSGTYADDDMSVWFYNVTNSVLIQPAPYLIKNHSLTSDRYFAEVQVPYNCDTLRLIIYMGASTTTNFVMKIDDLVFGPQAKSYGAVSTDWVTDTVTGTWVSNTTYICKSKFIGDWKFYQVHIALSGAPTSTTLVLTLTGTTIDTSKLASTTVGDTGIVMLPGATGYARDNGTAEAVLDVSYNSSTAVIPWVRKTDGTYQAISAITQASPWTWGNGDALVVNFAVPVLGKSSSQLLSSDASTRVVAASSALTSATHTATGTWQTLPSSTWTNSIDTHGVFVNGTYTVAVPGNYAISGMIGFSANATGIRSIKAVKNGVELNACDGMAAHSGDDNFCQLDYLLNLKAGDAITFKGYQNSGGNLGYSNSSQINIRMLSGPAQIAASETVAVMAGNSSGQSIPNASGTVVTGWTKTLDTHGAFNASTGIFTAPISGLYYVTGYFIYDSATWSAGNYAALNLGGTFSPALYDYYAPATFTNYLSLRGGYLVRLLAGNTASLTLYQSTGSSKSLYASTNYNHMSIIRVGNY